MSQIVLRFILLVSDSFEVAQGTSWIKGNCGMYGFYRMNYDESGWNATILQLNVDHKVSNDVSHVSKVQIAFPLSVHLSF